MIDDPHVLGLLSQQNRYSPLLVSHAGSCNSDVRIYRPDKTGKLQLVKTVKVNFKASLFVQGSDFAKEEFNCIDCKCVDTRMKKSHLPSRKIRCFACQTKYTLEYRRIKRADRRFKANKNEAA